MRAVFVAVTPTIGTTAYDAGDQIGTYTKLDNVLPNDKGVVMLESLVLIDASKQAKDVQVLFFNAEPTLASADNAALDMTDANFAAGYLGTVSVVEADYTTFANASAASKKDLGLLMGGLAGSNDLWIVLRTPGTPDYITAADLTLKFGFLQY